MIAIGSYIHSDRAAISGFVIGRATSNGVPMLTVRTADGALAYLAEERVVQESRPIVRLAALNGVRVS